MASGRSASLATWRRQALRRIAAVRKSTLAFVGRLPESEILRPRTQDRWSIRDVLAHLTTCDEETVRRFQLTARGQAGRIHWLESMAGADRFNARPAASARRLGLRALLRRMERAQLGEPEGLAPLPSE